MSTITKEQAQKIIEAADEVITALAGTNEDVHPESDSMLRLWDDLNDRYAPPEVVRELARIALASLEAEPVAWTWEIYGGGNMYAKIKPASLDANPLYTAPPAPVSVPDFGALTKCIVQRLVDYGAADDDAIASAEEFVYNACRAAMLQGADGNSPVIPDGWVMVPVEPTPEMINSAMRDNETGEVSEIYELMIAASPKWEVNQ